MKRFLLIFVVLLLVAGILFVPRLLNHASGNEGNAAPEKGENALTASDSASEPVYVSDPVYGDQLTEEELEQLKEEDAAESSESSSFVVGEEFVIELGETQDVAGF